MTPAINSVGAERKIWARSQVNSLTRCNGAVDASTAMLDCETLRVVRGYVAGIVFFKRQTDAALATLDKYPK